MPDRELLVASIAGPMYDSLYRALPEFTRNRGEGCVSRARDSSIYWIEEPIHPDDIESHVNLARKIAPMRIALGEHGSNKVLFNNFMARGPMHFVQADCTRLAGVSEFIAVSLLARKYGLPVVPHVGDMGQILFGLSVTRLGMAKEFLTGCLRYSDRQMSTYLPSRRELLALLAASPTAPSLLRAETDYTAWYREAKFGMFIHWGPYSLASVEASWPIMRPSKEFPISEEQYRALPQQFNPTKFDPAAFVDLAKTAHQKYMVFTTKHHDGFCMFDSAYTDYKITNTPYKKDIVGLLAEACHSASMPIGFYYSPPDMNHPAFRDTSKPASGNWNGEPMRSVWPLYLDYMELQLRELLTRYGEVALIWFDGLYNQRKFDGERIHRAILACQAQTLINNRIGIPGDYETPEQFLPAAIPVKGKKLDWENRDTGTKPNYIPEPEEFRLWETCMTINNTWAYNKNDHEFKSSSQLIRTLVEVASRGGNFLLNVGPQPDGVIQPEFQERLRAIGKWMDRNSESIHGTTYGPVQGAKAFRTTAKGWEVFLHVFDWPGTALEVTAENLPKFHSASLLANGQPLQFKQGDGRVTIDLPAEALDPDVTVITLRS